MTANGGGQLKLTDFDDRVDIIPISNPDIFSSAQRIAMAQEMMNLVQSNPQIHGLMEFMNLIEGCICDWS